MNGEGVSLIIVTDLEGVERIVPGKLSGKGTVKCCRQETAACSGSSPLQPELLALAPWVAGTLQGGNSSTVLSTAITAGPSPAKQHYQVKLRPGASLPWSDLEQGEQK